MSGAAYPPDIMALLGEPAPTDVISEADLADVLGISPRSIRELATRGVIRKAARGRYPMRDSVRAYCANLREQAAARSSSGTLTAERIRIAREQADALELKNAVARREMIPVRDVEATWSAVLRDVRAAMLAIPARIQQRLGGLSAHDVSIIDREIRDSLEEISSDSVAG